MYPSLSWFIILALPKYRALCHIICFLHLSDSVPIYCYMILFFLTFAPSWKFSYCTILEIESCSNIERAWCETRVHIQGLCTAYRKSIWQIIMGSIPVSDSELFPSYSSWLTLSFKLYYQVANFHKEFFELINIFLKKSGLLMATNQVEGIISSAHNVFLEIPKKNHFPLVRMFRFLSVLQGTKHWS